MTFLLFWNFALGIFPGMDRGIPCCGEVGVNNLRKHDHEGDHEADQSPDKGGDHVDPLQMARRSGLEEEEFQDRQGNQQAAEHIEEDCDCTEPSTPLGLRIFHPIMVFQCLRKVSGSKEFRVQEAHPVDHPGQPSADRVEERDHRHQKEDRGKRQLDRRGDVVVGYVHSEMWME